MTYKLKELRLKKGLTQDELSRESGVNRTTIIQLENGENVNVTIKTLKQLAKCLGVDIKEIVD
ncbi:helix-turn-helix transcriptional regulator [uncultured Thomasclavelia sp.]|uniref:helix-turn-helix domain-containing protein n=1 Tax=uncultured Thomasclavelia sp. TaxID=3025759 RepID=UPI0034591F06